MKIGALSVLTLSVLALTACGGGGSSGVSTTPTVVNVVQPTSDHASFDPANIKNDATDPISGQHWQAQHTKDASKYTLNNTKVGDNITQIVVSGQTFDLQDVDRLTYLGDNQLGVKYGTTTHSRFGVGWQADDANTIFYQGYQTLPKDMPKTGTAKYAGQAFHDCATCGDSEAKASFDVDFGKKTVAGVIDHKAQKVNLSATISGSSFSGVANGVQTNGAFYGIDASELSGIYKETDGKFAGAFGATKTE